MTPINILIVDDVPEHLQNAGTILKELGYPIRVALNGRDALRHIKRQRPSIVLLDVSMEGMDGFQVCRAIPSIDTSRSTMEEIGRAHV